MDDPPEPRHNRRSIRMPLFDYAHPGFYFVTICAFRRRCVFGSILNGEVCLTPLGRVVADEWARTAALRSRVRLDSWVVMPNHFHGIIQLVDQELHAAGTLATPREVRASRAALIDFSSECAALRSFGKPVTDSLPSIIGAFKAAVTRRSKRVPGLREGNVWQRGYFEHVIRDEQGLQRAREYIESNPARWEFDKENPGRRTPGA